LKRVEIFLRKFLHRWALFVPLRSQATHKALEKFGNIAQLVEHSTENAGVVGSIPTVATSKRLLANRQEPFCLLPFTAQGLAAPNLVE
jgi:hypothetical protein